MKSLRVLDCIVYILLYVHEAIACTLEQVYDVVVELRLC